MRFTLMLLLLLIPEWVLAETWRVDTDTSLRRVCAEKGIQVYKDKDLQEPLIFLRQGEATRFFTRSQEGGQSILLVQPALEIGYAADADSPLCYMEYALRRICPQFETANILRGPSGDFGVVDSMRSGETFRFYKVVSNGFIYIRYQRDDEWREGWLSGSTVCQLPDQTEKPDSSSLGTVVGPGDLGEQLASFYVKNYGTIKREVGFTINACSAFATTAMRKFGIKLPYEEWAPNLRSYVAKRGWLRITDRRKVKTGDLVFTRDERTAIDQLTNHVFIVEKVNGDGTVMALDNQGRSYRRFLYGTAKQSEMWDAYRPEK